MEHMSPWKRYVDDTTAVIKLSSIEHVLSLHTSFHQNIESTYELKKNRRINFLDVTLVKTNYTLQTTIYRKRINNVVYLHRNSFALRTWKCGTLRIILIWAYEICSTKEPLQNELEQIKEEFIKINNYPKWVFDQLNEECKLLSNADYDSNATTNNEIISTTHRLILPYKREQRQEIITLFG